MRRVGFPDILGVALLLGAALSMPSRAGDPGLGWHLKAGQWMLEELRIPRQDPFLLTSAGKEWVHNQWLSDLILYKLFSWGGWPLLQWLMVGIVVFIAVRIVPQALRESGQGPLETVLCAAVALFFLVVQWFLRPVLFSFLLFALLYRVLYPFMVRTVPPEENAVLSPASVWNEVRSLRYVPFIFLFWANLHSGFVMGLGLIGIAALTELFHRDRSLSHRSLRFVGLVSVGVCSVLATLFNPYGVKLHLNILRLVGDPYFMNLNQEWLSPDLHLGIFAPLGIIVLIFTALLALRKDRRLTPFELVSALCFLYAAFQGRRYLPFLGIVLTGPLATLLKVKPLLDGVVPSSWRIAFDSLSSKELRATSGGPTIALWAGICVHVLATGTLLGRPAEQFGFDPFFPRPAAEMLVKEQQVEGRHLAVFHSPDWGGFLTYHGLRPFIDDRNELNGKEMYERYFTINNLTPGWEQLIEEYNFDFILLEKSSPLRFILLSRADWPLVHQDSMSLLFRRATRLRSR